MQSPCKGADQHYRRLDHECRCNVNRLSCDPETSFWYLVVKLVVQLVVKLVTSTGSDMIPKPLNGQPIT